MRGDFDPPAGGPRMGEYGTANADEPDTSSDGIIIVMRPETGEVIGRRVDAEYARCIVLAEPPEPLRRGTKPGLCAEPTEDAVLGRLIEKAHGSATTSVRSCAPGR